MTDPAPSGAEIDWSRLQDLLPLGVAVVDSSGTVRSVSGHALTMLGRTEAEVVGRSVLELIVPEDLEFVADVLADGTRFGGEITGPVGVHYVGADGRPRSTRVWARNCLGVEGIDGYVVTFAEPSAADALAAAAQLAVSHDGLDAVLSEIAATFAGHPFLARAAIVRTGADDLVVSGDWPLADVPPSRGSTPWGQALAGSACDVHSPSEMPEEIARAAATADVESIWARPVVAADGHVAAAIVVWRSRSGPATPNQRHQLDGAVAIAALAVDEHAHRRTVENAIYVDPLTGLGNRRRYERLVAGHGVDPLDGGRDLAGVLYVDLDGFKAVNDRYGHELGDEILAEVGARLAGSMRTTDEVVRVGGDEFVVACGPPVTAEVMERLAERLIESLSRPYETAVGEVRISASVGIDAASANADLREAIGRADQAMYAAKAAGRGTWRRWPVS